MERFSRWLEVSPIVSADSWSEPMSEVIYYKGLTIESEAELPRLTIEGQRLLIRRVADSFHSDVAPGIWMTSLPQLAKEIVERSPEFTRREVVRKEHLSILADGVDRWNAWRRQRPEIRPLLYEASLSSEERPAALEQANFANAVLIGADLSHAHLEGVNFHGANLGGAKLRGAHLQNANFCTTDLFRTDLSRANLTGANLQGTQLTLTSFEGATLVGCTIYGISAWDLKLDGAVQQDLTVFYEEPSPNGNRYEENRFVVHDLKSAQFVYSLLQNRNVRDALHAVSSKTVLILGRFRDDGLEVLQAAASRLRQLDYLPIIFDFERPRGRNFDETVKTLYGLSRFVIADLSGRSVAAELSSNVRDFYVPVVPILQQGREASGTIEDLLENPQRWPVLGPIVEFAAAAELVGLLDTHIVTRAENWAIAHQSGRARAGAPAP
jgi:hypothetical protein